MKCLPETNLNSVCVNMVRNHPILKNPVYLQQLGMLQCHLLNVHTQNKYLRLIGTLFLLKWLPSLISNCYESFTLVQQQGPVYMSDFIPG